MKMIRIVHAPLIKPSEAAPLPYIEMPDPVRPKEVLIPEIIFGDDDKPEEADRYFFDLPMHAAQRVLATDSEIYLLWEPEVLKVPVQNGLNGVDLVVMKSVKPLALAGATNLRDPKSVPAKKAEQVPPPPPPPPAPPAPPTDVQTPDASLESGSEQQQPSSDPIQLAVAAATGNTKKK